MASSGGGLSAYNILLFYLVFQGLLTFMLIFTDFGTVTGINVILTPPNFNSAFGILELIAYFFLLAVYAPFASNGIFAIFALITITPMTILILYIIVKELIRG